MIPMRDGVKLHTIIYTPKSRSGPLPILFNRTPYGIDNMYRGISERNPEGVDRRRVTSSLFRTFAAASSRKDNL